MNENLDNFDWNYYLENNKDLYSNGINSKKDAVNHWIKYGKNENREYKFINNLDKIDFISYIEKIKNLENKNNITKEDSWNLLMIIYDKIYNNSNIENIENFDWIYYIKKNIDLIDNNILSKEDIISHWIKFGKNENRIHKFNYNIIDDIDNSIDIYIENINNSKNMDNFDWVYYIQNNQDLLDNNINTRDDAIQHWNNYGKNEKRAHRFEKKFSENKTIPVILDDFVEETIENNLSDSLIQEENIENNLSDSLIEKYTENNLIEEDLFVNIDDILFENLPEEYKKFIFKKIFFSLFNYKKRDDLSYSFENINKTVFINDIMKHV